MKERQEFAGTGRYEVRGHLGTGASGDVYKVFDRKLRTLVALKTLHKTDPVAIHRFKREFRSLTGVDHPNLAQLYELESHEGRWFFTMELVEGPDFVEHAQLRNGAEPAAVERLRGALRQLAEGLRALHDAGMLHRDVKPSNVRVTAGGRVVLLDFGLVKELFDASVYETLEGAEVSGTPAYMSPEQAAGLKATPASDWYSVGAVLYQALTGRLPFPGGFLKMLTDKQKTDPPPPAEVVPGVPADLADLAMALQAREPAARPGGGEVLRRLGAAAPASRQGATHSSGPGAPYVGREAHLERLLEAFRATCEGRTEVVWVEGSSGMGKSSLVRHFLSLARQEREDAVVLVGRCHERESVPYKALDELIDALSRFLRQLPDHEVEVLMPANVRALGRLFPALRRVPAVAGAHREAVAVPDSREQRRRAFAALRELLGRLGQRRPLVLSIDDLQWGDLDSAALLIEILRPPDPPPLLLVGTFTAEERQTSPLLQELLAADFGDAAEVREVLVQELSPAATRQLVLELLGERGGGAQALADAIAQESGGNPFFVDELVRLARTEAGRDRDGGSLPAEMERALAHAMSVERMIEARLERLSPEARRLLEAVAVAGRPTALDVARQAAELGRDTQAAVTSLRGASLVRIRSSREREEIETYHDRIREAVTRTLDEARKSHLHRRLALALEGSGRADPETLAHHYHGAGDRQMAAKFAGEAGDQAQEALAFDRAARLYRIAAGHEAFAAAEARVLQVKLGEALSNAGRGAEAARAFLRGAEGAMAARALELRRRAAEQLLISGRIDEGLETVRAVLASIGMKLTATPRRTLLSLAWRILRLKLRGRGFKERDPSQISAEELIRVDTCWSVSIGLGTVDTIRGMDFGKRHLLLALRAGEPYRVARALAIEAGYSATGGSKARERTSGLVREAMTLAERVGHPHALGLANMTAGVAAYLEGRWKRALELLDRAEGVLRDHCTGVTWELDTAMSFQLRSLLLMGEVGEVRKRLPRCLKDVRDRGDLYAEVNLRSRVAWVVHLADDRPDRALAELADAIGRWSQRGFHIQHYWHLTGQVETALYRGDAVAAWEALEGAWPRIGRSLLLRIQFTRTEGRHLRCRGALAAAAAAGVDTARGKALLKLVDGELRRIAAEKVSWARPLVELVRAGLATLKGDGGTAQELLVSAAAGFDAADMGLYAAVARRRRGELAGGDERLVREADAWMTAHGIRNFARMSDVLAPGRWSDGSP